MSRRTTSIERCTMPCCSGARDRALPDAAGRRRAQGHLAASRRHDRVHARRPSAATTRSSASSRRKNTRRSARCDAAAGRRPARGCLPAGDEHGMIGALEAHPQVIRAAAQAGRRFIGRLPTVADARDWLLDSGADPAAPRKRRVHWTVAAALLTGGQRPPSVDGRCCSAAARQRPAHAPLRPAIRLARGPSCDGLITDGRAREPCRHGQSARHAGAPPQWDWIPTRRGASKVSKRSSRHGEPLRARDRGQHGDGRDPARPTAPTPTRTSMRRVRDVRGVQEA